MGRTPGLPSAPDRLSPLVPERCNRHAAGVMDLQLHDKVALVLASSSGLGRATALALAAEGASVALFARREAELARVASAITAAGGKPPLLLPGDLTDPAGLAAAIDRAAAHFGRLDILVNNCGGPPAGTFSAFADDAWQRAFELTLLSYVRAIRAVLPHLRAAGRGWILNIASASVKAAIDGLLLSNVFRLGVTGLTKTLAVELAPDRILVNLLGPGRIATDRLEQLDRLKAEQTGQTLEAVRAAIVKTIPAGRLGEPAEFARAAVFLCSPANTFISGQALVVDGGMVRAY